MLLGLLCQTLAAGLAPAAAGPSAPPQEVRAEILAEIPEIKPGVYLLASPEGNTLVLLGDDGPLVLGVPAPGPMAMTCQFLALRGAPPLRYAIIADADGALQRGDGGWGKGGATTISHENIRRHVRWAIQSDSSMAALLPEIGFSQVFQIVVNGEEIHAIHEPGGFSDADMIVHFEDRHFIWLGNMFTTDGYPAIDLERGGSIEGLIRSASKFLGMWERTPEWVEPVVPGRGPLGTMRDLRAYHDMLVAVRDRVAPMVSAGKTLEEVVAARPTAAFDARWGRGPVPSDRFAALVYRSLAKEAARKSRQAPAAAGEGAGSYPSHSSHGSHRAGGAGTGGSPAERR